ncbi:MAG TPA: hypothetical protein VIO87_07415, partial [Methylotenera sp.]
LKSFLLQTALRFALTRCALYRAFTARQPQFRNNSKLKLTVLFNALSNTFTASLHSLVSLAKARILQRF